jgi:DNA polymerase-3 subunit delta
VADVLAPIVLTYGDARPLVDAAVESVRRAALARCGIPAFNHGRFRSNERGSEALVAARTPPMMADLRLVELHGLEECPAELADALIEYAERPDPTTVLLLVGNALPPAKGGANPGVRLKNAVKKVGRVVECKAEDVDPVAFATEAARTRGKTLVPLAARRVVEWVGADPGLLQGEVAKLCDYVGERVEIAPTDVDAVVSALAEAEVWDLTAAVAARDADRALDALARLVDGGEDPRRLLAMIAWQLRDVCRVVELYRGGANDQQVRDQVRMRWETLKHVKQAVAAAPDTAVVMADLARAHRSMNEHKAGDRRILERLVLSLST